ncbi:MAG: hypothetical protein KY459_04470 [Acidobacteria bacterium]|nr:hypothetical protein [Acidobacteriota bacterium]
MRISSGGPRRRVALALLVAGIPGLLLLILASRMVDQEKELERNRDREVRERFAAEIEQRMLHRLDRVRLALSSGQTPDPVPELIAFRNGSILELPWSAPESYEPWPSTPEVRSAIARGEAEELIAGRPDRALRHYRHGVEISRSDSEAAYAKLLLARALHRTGRAEEALISYREVLRLPPSARDDQQIPLALYAAERLAGPGTGDMVPWLERHLDPSIELPPAALHLLSDIASALGSAPLTAMVEARLERISRANQLQHNLPAVLPQPADGNGLRESWTVFGDWLWIVGSAEVGGKEAVITVAAEDLIDAMIARDPTLKGMHLTRGWNEDGVVASTSFPGIGIALPPVPAGVDEAARSRRTFFFLALGFVFLTSLTAAGMLLRDVRREVETAELRSEFVSSVSHELKTPLSAIRMFAESLQMGRPATSKQRDEYLELILNESERLSRLLDNVLEFSKIERGDRQYRLEARDLGEVVRRSLRGAAYPLQQKGFRLALHVEEGLPPVKVDEDAVEQALLNLLTNAMKYSGDCLDLQVRLEREGDGVALRVIDHGIGIPEEEKEKIFEKFYRATNSVGVTGAGLGLPIVAHIARMHGGMLLLKSRPGAGSEFTITFPLEAV